MIFFFPGEELEFCTSILGAAGVVSSLGVGIPGVSAPLRGLLCPGLPSFNVLQCVGWRPLSDFSRQRRSPPGRSRAAPQCGDERRWGAERRGGRGLVKQSVLVACGRADARVVHTGQAWCEQARVWEVSV